MKYRSGDFNALIHKRGIVVVISTLALVIFYTICGHFNKHSVRSFSGKKIENWEIEKILVGDLFDASQAIFDA